MVNVILPIIVAGQDRSHTDARRKPITPEGLMSQLDRPFHMYLIDKCSGQGWA